MTIIIERTLYVAYKFDRDRSLQDPYAMDSHSSGDGSDVSSLFSKIVAGAHPRLVVDEELSHSSLDEVHTGIGLTKDSLSIVDEQLNVDDVCAMSGQHVKFIRVTDLGLGS